jgi:hypothetical protein
MAGGLSGGTGQKLTQATIIVAGVAALLASLLSVVCVACPNLLYGHQLTFAQVRLVANVTFPSSSSIYNS